MHGSPFNLYCVNSTLYSSPLSISRFDFVREMTYNITERLVVLLKNILRIGFDIDGVLCSIIPECLSAGKKHGLIPEDVKISDICDDFKKQFDWTDEQKNMVFNEFFYKTLPPHQNVIKSIKKWLLDGHYILYITARQNNNTVHMACIDWLKEHGIYDYSQGCIHEHSSLKYIKAQEHNLQIFIDDHPKVIETMIDKIEHPFLLEGPINHGCLDGYRFSWLEISEKINSMIK